MPEMDGFEASKQILKLTADAGEPDYVNIVALTSFTSLDVRKRVVEIGIKEMVNKPINHIELQRVLLLYFIRKDPEELRKKHPNLFKEN